MLNRSFLGVPAVGDVLVALKAIAPMALMIDAIAGMAGDGTKLTSISDLSGNGKTITIDDAGGHSPRFGPTRWNSAQPAMGLISGNNYQVVVSSLVVPQPFTVVMLLQNFASDIAGASQNIYRDAAGAVGYCITGTTVWSLFAGSVLSSTFTAAASQGRRCRIDVVNGASSFICRGSTEQSGDAGSGSAINGNMAIGAGPAATAPITAEMPFFAIYSSALTAVQRAKALSLLQLRYSGITPT